MVVLNRIYTRTGDDGTTALGTGERRKKYDLRIAAYGSIDELNAVIGIARLQAAGSTDKTIIDQFVAEFGPVVYRGNPSAYGWLVPYLSIIPGLAFIWWFVRRYRKPRPIAEIGPAPDDSELARYRERIEKDLAHLE